jgi:hypothetical protein
MLLGLGAEEVIDVVQPAVFNEQGVTAEPRGLSEDHPCVLVSTISTLLRIL